MKKRALVTGGSKSDIPAMAVLVMNIKELMPDMVDEIVIFHDGISESDQKIVKNLFPVRFIKYEFPGDTSHFSHYAKFHFTPMVFCKYECFSLLSEYRTVVWSDYDVVIKADISEEWRDGGSAMRILPAPSATIRQSFLPSIGEEDMNEFDMGKESLSMGILVLHDTLPDFSKIYDWCIERTVMYGKHLYLPEQAIISIMVQHFKIKPDLMRHFKQAHPLHSTRPEKEEAKILHAYGQPKFWNGLHDGEWNRRYKEWKRLGGSTYPRLRGVLMRNVKLILKQLVKKVIG